MKYEIKAEQLDRLIEKQKEYIAYLTKWIGEKSQKMVNFESEISILKSNYINTNDMKHSIKERAKKVPAKIKLKVWVHCLLIDIKYYLNKICESDLEADISLKHLSNKFCTADKYILISPSKHDFTITDKIEEPIEDYPVYDEKYLNECIKKAAPNLSKIKDVDKALDEIRGTAFILTGKECY